MKQWGLREMLIAGIRGWSMISDHEPLRDQSAFRTEPDSINTLWCIGQLNLGVADAVRNGCVNHSPHNILTSTAPSLPECSCKAPFRIRIDQGCGVSTMIRTPMKLSESFTMYIWSMIGVKLLEPTCNHGAFSADPIDGVVGDERSCPPSEP